MLTRVTFAALLLMGTMPLGGCAWYALSQVKAHRSGLEKLQVGMSEEQVLVAMGEPEKRETHGQLEFLIYVTDAGIQPETLRITPVGLVEGRVSGWGKTFYDGATRSAVTLASGH